MPPEGAPPVCFDAENCADLVTVTVPAHGLRGWWARMAGADGGRDPDLEPCARFDWFYAEGGRGTVEVRAKKV